MIENKYEILSPELNEISGKVVSAAFAVHKALGPGLLESVYETCLAHELEKRGLHVCRQVDVSVQYDGLIFDQGFRIDILVNNRVVIELKTVEAFQPVHEAQLMTYLKLTKNRLGLLINFNVPVIKSGIKRVIL